MTGAGLELYLARAAARERDARVRNYPAIIEDGKIERNDAEADIAAWRAIAELLERGEALTSLGFAELELATSRALLRREEALAECPAPTGDLLAQAEAAATAERRLALLARRDAVWAIHERISHQRQLLDMRPSAVAIAA